MSSALDLPQLALMKYTAHEIILDILSTKETRAYNTFTHCQPVKNTLRVDDLITGKLNPRVQVRK